jgi:3-oxoacyl-[acyl-carrier-protein] synthase II
MKLDRVVVTGLGTVNALACSVPDFSRGLKAGRCGIGPITVFDTADFRTHNGGQAWGLAPREMIPRNFSLKRMSRSDGMAFVATLEALNDAGLCPLATGLQGETAVVMGGGAGGMLECEPIYRDHLLHPERGAGYSNFAAFNCASSADRIATHLGLMGPKTTFMTACSSGATAVGYAGDLVRTGTAPVAICGGTEPLCRVTYAAFNALQAVDPESCKPFDKDRRGLSLGEGAGILILEALSHARQRRARIYAEVLGYGVSCDAHHMTAPDPQGAGAVLAMRRALEDARLAPEAVDYINAHGTATPANDLMETRAIRTVFGARAYNLPVSSTKSMIGHTLGAAGAIESVVSVLAIHDGFIPPTIHLRTPDPQCDLDYVTEGARASEPNVVLSNSFAFGGNNTSLIFGRFTDPGVPHA